MKVIVFHSDLLQFRLGNKLILTVLKKLKVFRIAFYVYYFCLTIGVYTIFSDFSPMYLALKVLTLKRSLLHTALNHRVNNF